MIILLNKMKLLETVSSVSFLRNIPQQLSSQSLPTSFSLTFTVSNQVANEERVVYKGRPKRGRKLKVPGQTRADRKRLYNTNKTRINTKGNVCNEKLFDEHFECMCLLNCTGVVPIDERRRLFSQFWSQGDFQGRCSYIKSCVIEIKKKKVANGAKENDATANGTKENGSQEDGVKKPKIPRKYFIDGIEVCQKALLGTLQINECRVTTALKKVKNCKTLCDLRGKSRGGWNALPPAKTNEVRAHIGSFPKYVSHYTRDKTESKYLSVDLSLAKIYDLYKEEANEPASKSFYDNIFYNDFNLRFKTPKKDTCHKCDLYIIRKKQSIGANLQECEDEHEAHLEQAESLQAQMKADCAAAKQDIKMETLTFDLQKTLQLPKLPTSIAYYKRQLNLYNFGIHIGSTGEDKFNLWTEDEASKGTQEVGSCLKLHISTISKPIKKLIFWSDSCGGQNRSIKLVLMMMSILLNHQTLQQISMRYLLSGHSFLPNDTEFGEAETAFKHKERLYTDEQYMDVMKKCRTKNRFVVNRMSRENFLSVQALESVITNRKTDLTNQKVSWLDTHEILIEKDQPYIMKMSEKIGGPYQIVNLEKSGCKVDLKNVVLGSLWPTGRPLSKEKVKDLKDLIGLVPLEHRGFYELLNHVEEANFIDDVDGFGEFIDFEMEKKD